MRWLLLLALVGCGGDDALAPDAATAADADAAPDTRELPDDGFGFACTASDVALTSCTTSTGASGICALGVCRRRCDGVYPAPYRCPGTQVAIPTIGDACWCSPRQCGIDGPASCSGGELGR